ncbi:hypothetical protein [Pedobacter foliorum]|uniref:hypothetical protein n=1 Tax=Pedobacter foliorum TaxID=2739058 RepID=UPI00156759F6|nr:hypothetical protein [Pedobacter foliorum]NRF39335.1 hypothetical protein [Pedobacter foliorum]
MDIRIIISGILVLVAVFMYKGLRIKQDKENSSPYAYANTLIGLWGVFAIVLIAAIILFLQGFFNL